MSIVNLSGLSVTESSYRRARQIVENKPEGGKRTANDVLESLRNMMPGWTITTSASEWTGGARNIEISQGMLQRMADDPEEMVRVKALILDLEDIAPEIERWAQENPGQNLEFGITMDSSGALRAIAIVSTLLGGEVETTFELPADRGSWAELIREKLEALRSGQVEDVYGNRSWLA